MSRVPAYKQFGKIAAEVIIQAAVKRITVCDNPNGCAVEPILRKAAVTLLASGGQRSGKPIMKCGKKRKR